VSHDRPPTALAVLVQGLVAGTLGRDQTNLVASLLYQARAATWALRAAEDRCPEEPQKAAEQAALSWVPVADLMEQLLASAAPQDPGGER
jgi:hypothetical protein